ncbi:MAG: hypothetical protein ABTD50_18445 [Polyangiaceae bacterium]|jgi:hypothetical protein
MKDSARRRHFEQVAAAVAAAWVGGWFRDLCSEGRPVAGGWPGTLREVRELVRVELAVRRIKAKSQDELEEVARTAYAIARRRWLAGVERDETSEASV